MQQSGEVVYYDVVIAGAGPAGCACALMLKGAGLKVALLDKQSFPRDKVCGDAIPGLAIKTLKSICPAYETSFKAFPKKSLTKSTILFYKRQQLAFHWKGEAYTCTRMEFDNFLFSLVKAHTQADVLTNTLPENYIANADGITIGIKGGAVFKTKLLVGADGAQSLAAKQLTHKTLDRAHHVASVRAYYSNVAVTGSNTTEIYFNKRFLPSYLWVFPLPGNMANAGFGMLSEEIAKRNINIKKAFYEFIDQVPELKMRFKDAVQVSGLEGFGLPLGSKPCTVSGAHFMLTGDAASLIDPITGDGIGNAMLSGKLAAGQAIQCFRQNDFSAAFMKGYDNALYTAIGDELKQRYKAQRLLAKVPLLLDAVFFAGQNNLLRKLIQKGL